MIADEELLRDFLAESRENLDRLDQDLVVLEERPTDAEILARIFRHIHTIKGTCGFLGFSTLERVAHVGESLLDALRTNELFVNAAIATALLNMVDAIRLILGSIETTGNEGTETFAAVVDELSRLRQGAPAPETAPAATSIVNPERVPEPSREELRLGQAQAPFTRPPAPITAPGETDSSCPPPAAPLQASSPSPGASGAAGAGGTDTYVRVDVGLLDKLMNLVGELVLARNQVLQLAPSSREPGFQATSQRLNLITSELQSEVMKTRMQPISTLWDKLPRTVRDLALSCGKRVRVEMEGKDTELDRTIIEAIKDPLTHLVRNCIDHGIETPEARTAAGKLADGCLTLRAYHEGGQVNIEIGDDGKGLDAARIQQKAIERGLIAADQAARLSERELYNLIFLPGFSTADKVSNISGRGVGMDVVKTNVERIGGLVDLQSRPGAGTTFRIKIPLTLAIIPGLIVSCAGERYAIPQLNLQELVRLDPEQATRKIETVHGAPVYRLRGRLLPLLWLDEALGLGSAERRAAAQGTATNIVVLNADGRSFGLCVDQINDTEEIVVKSLGAQLKGLPAFSGATIMGDGRVALILDVIGIAQRGRVLSAHHDRPRAVDEGDSAGGASDGRNLLVLTTGSGRRMAVNLSTVARLEELPVESLEPGSEGPVVQYRGELLPVVELATLTGDHAGTFDAGDDGAPAKTQIIVFRQGARSVGIRVHRILDVVHERVELKSAGTRPGMLGLAVISGKATEMLDLQSLLGWGDPGATETFSASFEGARS